MLQIWRGIASSAPLSTPVVARKKEKERTVLNLRDVQSSTEKSAQRRKTAKHCKTSDEKQYRQYWMVRLVVANQIARKHRCFVEAL